MELATETPAKINLFLRVMKRRPDGYHNIETLFYPLRGLYDTVRVCDRLEPGISVHCDRTDLPTDRRNLAWQAAERFAEAARLKPAWTVTVEKRIPVAAGLGGGSSDAAAVLRLLNQAAGSPLSNDVLQQVAVQIGADVPFFLNPRTAVGTGIGDVLRPIPCPETLHLVLINPGFPVSTRWAYAHAASSAPSPPDIGQLIGVLGSPDSGLLAGRIYNSFESALCVKFPIVEILKECLCEAGAHAAQISGSGPTVFGLFPDPDAAALAARRVRDRFGQRYWVWRTGAV